MYRISVDYLEDKRYCSVQSLIKTGDLFGVQMCYHDIPDKLNKFDYETYASYPGNAAYILEKRRDEFLGRVQEIIDREGSFFIHKSTGMFRCKV